MTTALEAIKQHGNALDPSVKERWQTEQLVAIWNSVAQGATLAEFSMFTTLAAKYDLDPFAREIWFTKSKTGKTMLMVGRDGLLKVARRQPDFVNVDYDVHRANDTFKVTRQADGTRTVHHEYSGSAADRGEIVGAWAMIERVGGKFTNYTYTPLVEYKPSGASDYSPWQKQESAMIAKCAVSLCLRIGYGISGVVGEDEVANQFDGPEVAQSQPEPQTFRADMTVLASPKTVNELKVLAQGLSENRLKLVLGSVGVPVPDPFDIGSAFDQVPADVAGDLARALASAESTA